MTDAGRSASDVRRGVVRPGTATPASAVATTQVLPWLARAVALAQPAVTRAAPNPAVGCVIVLGDRIVGEGATAPPGGPHAEVVALEAAGDAARGADAYVSLEPCAHHGRTPPCVEALVAAGIRRVVIAHPDPNPLAAGGAARLIEAGVEVVGPLPADALLRQMVAGQLEGFLSLVERGRPHVTLKLAQTSDGQLFAPDGGSWVTGAAARRAVHRWRAERDAVLVGVGTVLADDPALTVRHVDADHQPRPVVLDTHLRTPVHAAVVRPGAVVVTSTSRAGPAAARLRDRGVEVVEVPAGGDGRVSLRDAMRRLGELGLCSVLAEPGRTLADALRSAGLVDRLVLHVAGSLGSGPPARAIGEPPGTTWRTERVGGAGTDLVLHLVPVAPPTGRTAEPPTTSSSAPPAPRPADQEP